MIELKNLQENFQLHLLKKNQAIMQQITGVTEDLVKIRLSIYDDAYRFRLLNALSNDYPALEQYMGHEDFAQMGFAYIKLYPSRCFGINIFGQSLASFLATTEPYSQKPYLSELAGFIWMLNSTVDAANAPILTVNDIMAIPQDSWGEMLLTLQPSVKIYKAKWNVLPIWQALIQNQQSPAPLEQNTETACLLWRKGTQPYYSILAEQDVWIFNALQKSQSFGEICDGLLKWFPEEQVATYAVNLLLQWLNDEMLCNVELQQTES